MTNFKLDIESITPISEIKFEHLNEKYKKVQVVGIILSYLFLMGLSLLLLLTDNVWWCI